jgi:Zn-finger nucleic acid-binding protein
MKQLGGGVTVDRGYRESTPTTSRSSSPERSAPGSDLGRYGNDSWEIPGFGDRGPRCGEWYPDAVCSECGEVSFTTHTCGRRVCPDCWGVWAKEAAVRATKRVQAFRYTQPDNHRRQVAHAYVSPPPEEVRNERQFYQWKKKAADIAEEKGFRGFAVIPHPYRATKETKQEHRDVDPDDGIWVWIREQCDSMQEIEEMVRWSPHYHIIGLTSLDMDEAEESDEAVYQFKRSLERFDGVRDQDSHEDMYGAFRYLYSHAGWPSGSRRDATTWHGALANNKFVEEATESWQHQKPSDGILSALQREIEEVAGPTEDDDREETSPTGVDDKGECPCDDCGGVLIDVFDTRAYCRQAQPPPEVRDTMQAAREWRLGAREPPPGLKKPQTEEQAREAFQELL